MKIVIFILIVIFTNMTILISSEFITLSGKVQDVSTKKGISDVNIYTQTKAGFSYFT